MGIVSAIAQKALFPDLPEYEQLGIIAALSLAASVIATYLTKPTDEDCLVSFYRKTRPFGLWPRSRKVLATEELADIRKESLRDLASVIPALGFFFFLFLMPMYLLVRKWESGLLSLLAVAIFALILYFTWYRHLTPSDGEDAPAAASDPASESDGA